MGFLKTTCVWTKKNAYRKTWLKIVVFVEARCDFRLEMMILRSKTEGGPIRTDRLPGLLIIYS